MNWLNLILIYLLGASYTYDKVEGEDSELYKDLATLFWPITIALYILAFILFIPMDVITEIKRRKHGTE